MNSKLSRKNFRLDLQNQIKKLKLDEPLNELRKIVLEGDKDDKSHHSHEEMHKKKEIQIKFHYIKSSQDHSPKNHLMKKF